MLLSAMSKRRCCSFSASAARSRSVMSSKVQTQPPFSMRLMAHRDQAAVGEAAHHGLAAVFDDTPLEILEEFLGALLGADVNALLRCCKRTRSMAGVPGFTRSGSSP